MIFLHFIALFLHFGVDRWKATCYIEHVNRQSTITDNKTMHTNWEIRIIGKCGKVATIKQGNVTFERHPIRIRKAVAAYWAIVKSNLTVGQSATITNGRASRTFNA